MAGLDLCVLTRRTENTQILSVVTDLKLTYPRNKMRNLCLHYMPPAHRRLSPGIWTNLKHSSCTNYQKTNLRTMKLKNQKRRSHVHVHFFYPWNPFPSVLRTEFSSLSNTGDYLCCFCSYLLVDYFPKRGSCGTSEPWNYVRWLREGWGTRTRKTAIAT